MSLQPAPVAPRPFGDKLARLAGFAAIFGGIGPAIGGVAAWSVMGPTQSPWPFITGAYPEAILLAGLVGFLTGVAALWLGWVSWVVPLAIALFANIVFILVSAGDVTRPDLSEIVARLSLAFLFPSVVASFICWLVANRLFLMK